MKFISVYKTAERETPPTQEEMDRMGKLIEEGMKAGWLLAVEGCMPSATGARVRKADGKTIVTDGPFAETKELIGGYWVIDAKSMSEAVEWAKRVPTPEAADMEVEIRQFQGLEEFFPVKTPSRTLGAGK